jgi:hypothetical protein
MQEYMFKLILPTSFYYTELSSSLLHNTQQLNKRRNTSTNLPNAEREDCSIIVVWVLRKHLRLPLEREDLGLQVPVGHQDLPHPRPRTVDPGHQGRRGTWPPPLHVQVVKTRRVYGSSLPSVDHR